MARCVLCIMLLVSFNASSSFAQANRIAKPKAPGADDQTEMRLRFRLDASPHDAQAHKQLSDLLEKRNAGRALVEADAAWLKDNPSDYDAEIVMRSWATVSLDDPDFALDVDRLMLQSNNRSDDEKDYDFLADRYAFALLDRGRDNEAIALLTRSAQLAPDSDAVWGNLASAYQQLGEYQKAIPYFRRALDLNNNAEETHADFSKALLQAGQVEESETEIRVAIGMESSEATDEFHQMMRRMSAAAKADPVASEFHIQLAKVYTVEKRFGEAVNEVSKAQKANSSDLSLDYLKAEIWDAAHDPMRAAAARRAAQDAIAAEFAKEAKAHSSKDEFTGQVTYMQEVFFMDTDPHDPLPFDGPHEAIVLLGPLATANKLKPMDKFVLGMAYCEKGDSTGCRQLSRESMAENPKLNTAKAHHNLGNFLRKGGDSEDAAVEYRTAYEMDAQNITYRNDYEATRKR